MFDPHATSLSIRFAAGPPIAVQAQGFRNGSAWQPEVIVQVDENELVLLRELDRPCCHNAGRQWAAVMQASLEEGETAPDVTVRYCECPLYATGAG